MQTDSKIEYKMGYDITSYINHPDTHINNYDLFIWVFLPIIGIFIYKAIDIFLIYMMKMKQKDTDNHPEEKYKSEESEEKDKSEESEEKDKSEESEEKHKSEEKDKSEEIKIENEVLRQRIQSLEVAVNTLEIETNVFNKKCDEIDNHLIAFISEVNVLIDAQEHRDIGHHTSTMFEARNKMRQLMHRREVYKGVENVPIDSASSYANPESKCYDPHKFIYNEHHPYSIIN